VGDIVVSLNARLSLLLYSSLIFARSTFQLAHFRTDVIQPLMVLTGLALASPKSMLKQPGTQQVAAASTAMDTADLQRSLSGIKASQLEVRLVACLRFGMLLTRPSRANVHSLPRCIALPSPIPSCLQPRW
jgi:hypothetical protein